MFAMGARGAAGGLFLAGSHASDRGRRSYRLYVPRGNREGRTALVVMLHGCFQGPDDFAAGTRMNDFAARENFLVLYPEQPARANMSRCWNWFDPVHQEKARGEPALISGMTQGVVEEYEIDPGRVYVAGMSAGGAMAGILGETYPEQYAAVGVHSGFGYKAAHDLWSSVAAMRRGGPDPADPEPDHLERLFRGEAAGGAVPTIVFHGDRDGTVHPRNGEQALRRFAEAEAEREDTDGDWVRATVQGGRVSGGRAYTRSVYHDTDGKPVAERWIVHGAGHAWSGGSPAGSYTDPLGPDASAEMTRFFLEHTRR